jgi:outer membrane murein-binding lipoprotein Lpp
MTAQRVRPTGTRNGAATAGRPAARAASTSARGAAAVAHGKVPAARRGSDTIVRDPSRRSAANPASAASVAPVAAVAAARDFPVDGSSALARAVTVEPELAEPVRRRSAAEREAADERAAQRAADRDAAVDSRHRLRVAPPLPVSVARAPFVATLLFVVVAGVVGILVLSTLINANQFKLNELQNKQATLNQQQQQLQQNLVQQEAPGSVVADANRLGLVPAGPLGYVQLPNGSVVGVGHPSTDTPSITAQVGH